MTQEIQYTPTFIFAELADGKAIGCGLLLGKWDEVRKFLEARCATPQDAATTLTGMATLEPGDRYDGVEHCFFHGYFSEDSLNAAVVNAWEANNTEIRIYTCNKLGWTRAICKRTNGGEVMILRFPVEMEDEMEELYAKQKELEQSDGVLKPGHGAWRAEPQLRKRKRS